MADIIDEIYKIKKRNDKFILSNGHAAIALYAVLEINKIITPEVTESLNLHPDRNIKLGIEVSSGSLGQGLPIAVGFALVDKNRRVYCTISDGESMEGSIIEALRIARMQQLTNLNVILNANGWGAYSRIYIPDLVRMLDGLGYESKIVDGHDSLKLQQALRTKSKDGPNLIIAETKSDQLPFLRDLDAHYYLMKEEDYLLSMKLLS
jgi:transketolase